MKSISKNYLKYLKNLKRKKYRKSEKRFLIEGEKLIKEALSSDADLECIICSREFYEKNPAIINVIKFEKIKILFISSRNTPQISDVVTPQGIFALVKIKENEFKPSSLKKNSELIALDNVSDAGNLGNIIRTAYWFGIDGIIVGKDSIELYNPKVIRASMGSIFHIPIWYDIELKEELPNLKKEGYKIIGTDTGGNDPIDKINKKMSKVIIFGNESNGISSEILNLCDYKIKIKGVKSFDSINLAVAAAIFMWEMKKHNLKKK